MKTLNTLQDLNKVKISNYRARYQKQASELTDEQIVAYRRLRYGIRAYSEQELSKMSPREIKSVIYTQERANNIISEMSQSKLNTFIIKTMKKVFPDLTGDAAAILTQPVFHQGFTVDNSITPLKVSQEEIYAEFKRRGLVK